MISTAHEAYTDGDFSDEAFDRLDGLGVFSALEIRTMLTGGTGAKHRGGKRAAARVRFGRCRPERCGRLQRLPIIG